jgi:uncharacterized protein YcbK (DUF882 family)
LKAERPRKTGGEGRAVLAALLAVLLASCTTADQSLDMASPGFNMAGADVASDSIGSTTPGTGLVMSSEGDTALPDQIAYRPVTKPGGTEVAAAAPDAAANPAPATDAAAAAQSGTDQQTAATAQTPAAQPAAEATKTAEAPKADAETTTATAPVPTTKDAAPDDKQVIVTATDPAAATAPIEPKKRGFLSAFFGGSPAAVAPAKPKPFAQITSAAPAKAEKAQPLVQLASASEDDAKPVAKSASLSSGNLDSLPGVRQTALFEIKRKSGIDDDSDVDLHEDEYGGPIQLASAAGLARLAPNGLLTQTERVDVACLKPSLVRVLKTVEKHYGRKIVVTSGYRSPSHNRRARGAKNSLHMYCAAADVQVEGVSKWELASYARNMPGRGGVGTYCHTNSVHIDVGPERDWNWRCRRRK